MEEKSLIPIGSTRDLSSTELGSDGEFDEYCETIMTSDPAMTVADWINVVGRPVVALISITCSMALIFRFLACRNKYMKKVKERLLLGLSIADVLFSTASFMSGFAIPSHMKDYINQSTSKNYKVVAIGNIATCQAQGWLYQIGAAPPMYVASLSLYYYFCATGGATARDEVFSKRVEPYLHGFIWFYTLTTASLTLGLGLIDQSGAVGCSVTDTADLDRCHCFLFPTHPQCTSVLKGKLKMWTALFTVPILAISIITIVVVNIMLFRRVARIETRARNWRTSGVMSRYRGSQAVSDTRSPSDALVDTSDRRSVGRLDNGTSALASAPTFAYAAGQVSEESSDRQVSEESSDPEASSHSSEADVSVKLPAETEATNHASSTAVEQESTADAAEPSDGGESSPKSKRRVGFSRTRMPRGTSSVSFGSARQSLRQMMLRTNSLRSSRKVQEFGVYYVVGFFLTYPITIINLLLPSVPIGMIVAGALTLPSQGLWNFLFYMRERFIGLRQRNEDVPTCNVFYETVFK